MLLAGAVACAVLTPRFLVGPGGTSPFSLPTPTASRPTLVHAETVPQSAVSPPHAVRTTTHPLVLVVRPGTRPNVQSATPGTTARRTTPPASTPPAPATTTTAAAEPSPVPESAPAPAATSPASSPVSGSTPGATGGDGEGVHGGRGSVGGRQPASNSDHGGSSDGFKHGQDRDDQHQSQLCPQHSSAPPQEQPSSAPDRGDDDDSGRDESGHGQALPANSTSDRGYGGEPSGGFRGVHHSG